MITPLEFVDECEGRGYSLSLVDDKLHCITTDPAGVPDSVRAYLRTHKADIVAVLAARFLGLNEDEDRIQLEVAEAEREVDAFCPLHAAAVAGVLPAVRVSLGAGHSTSDPAAYVQTAVARMRRSLPAVPAVGLGTYRDAMLNEWIGLAAVRSWWEGGCHVA